MAGNLFQIASGRADVVSQVLNLGQPKRPQTFSLRLPSFSNHPQRLATILSVHLRPELYAQTTCVLARSKKDKGNEHGTDIDWDASPGGAV